MNKKRCLVNNSSTLDDKKKCLVNASSKLDDEKKCLVNEKSTLVNKKSSTVNNFGEYVKRLRYLFASLKYLLIKLANWYYYRPNLPVCFCLLDECCSYLGHHRPNKKKPR